MNVVTTSFAFGPILGVLAAVVVVTVIVVVIASAVRGNRGVGAVTYFVFGLSLVTLTAGVSVAGVTAHSVSQLVGPTAESFNPPSFPDCSSISSTTAVPPSLSATTSTTVFPSGSSGLSDSCQGLNGNGQALASGGGYAPLNRAFLSASSDATNHFISVSVLAGLFLIVAASAYYLLWRRARQMVVEVGLGEPPVGALPITYGYLVAGLAVLSLLVFVPLFADNIFRAIAPGVNETSGHADGLRNLVTFGVLSGLSALILRYHLGYLRSFRSTESQGTDLSELDDGEETPES